MSRVIILEGLSAAMGKFCAAMAALLAGFGLRFLPGSGAKGKAAIGEALEACDRFVVVLSKGMLKARTLLRALEEPLDHGTAAVLSIEPPRSSWGPTRDANRDVLLRGLLSAPE